jgi:hypothetical protein
MTKIFAAVPAILLIISSAFPAQYVVGTKAGIIDFINGDVFLDEIRINLSPGSHLKMANGQSLRTEKGYAEVLLNPRAYLRLGENATIKMEEDRFSDTQLTLSRGSALIEITDTIEMSRIRISLAESVIEIGKPGLYRLNSDPRELRVFGGSAIATNGNKKYSVKRDKMIYLDKNAPLVKFNANESDSLHEWAAKRSYDLFIAEPTGQTHWTPVALGWIANINFHIRFRSQRYFDSWQSESEEQDYDALIKKAEEILARAQTSGLSPEDADILRRAIEAAKIKRELEARKKKTE